MSMTTSTQYTFDRARALSYLNQFRQPITLGTNLAYGEELLYYQSLQKMIDSVKLAIARRNPLNQDQSRLLDAVYCEFESDQDHEATRQPTEPGTSVSPVLGSTFCAPRSIDIDMSSGKASETNPPPFDYQEALSFFGTVRHAVAIGQKIFPNTPKTIIDFDELTTFLDAAKRACAEYKIFSQFEVEIIPNLLRLYRSASAPEGVEPKRALEREDLFEDEYPSMKRQHQCPSTDQPMTDQLITDQLITDQLMYDP